MTSKILGLFLLINFLFFHLVSAQGIIGKFLGSALYYQQKESSKDVKDYQEVIRKKLDELEKKESQKFVEKSETKENITTEKSLIGNNADDPKRLFKLYNELDDLEKKLTNLINQEKNQGEVKNKLFEQERNKLRRQIFKITQQIKNLEENINNERNSELQGMGLVHNENFVVSAPSEKMASNVLEKSNLLRKQIALEWLGEEIPLSIGQTSIHVKITSQREGCHTWPNDDPARMYHLVWIYCPEKDLDNALTHEITHTVLETRYPNKQFPVWAQEAIATINDEDQQRNKLRNQVLGYFIKTNNWPNIGLVLNAENISGKEFASYAIANSIGEYLIKISGNNKKKFAEFAVDSKKIGLDAALKKYYGIKNVSDLQIKWQEYLIKTLIVIKK
jgi:hypothetical protein